MLKKEHSVSTPCPVCQGKMTVTELRCDDCDITVRGSFGAPSEAAAEGRFDRLNADQMTFVETFLRCRGVIRDVEAALGISYPTVRARLDSLLSALGLGQGAASPAAVESDAPSVKSILSQLESGTIDAGAALDAIRHSGGDGSTKAKESV